jgi:hypothetical protein
MNDEFSCAIKDKIDKKFLESEEWFDLVIKSIEESTRTRNVNKIAHYAKILRGAATIQDRNQYHPEDYLNMIIELTPEELSIAKILYDKIQLAGKGKKPELYWASKSGLKKLADQKIIPRADYDYVLLRLQRVGLIKEVTGTFLDYEGGEYILTDAFKKLMDYISDKAS